MTKQLEDLFTSFSDMTGEEQLAKIREVRHNRTIVRPAVAKKRAKKEAKKSQSNKDKLKAILRGMTAEEKQAFLENLQ